MQALVPQTNLLCFREKKTTDPCFIWIRKGKYLQCNVLFNTLLPFDVLDLNPALFFKFGMTQKHDNEEETLCLSNLYLSLFCTVLKQPFLIFNTPDHAYYTSKLGAPFRLYSFTAIVNEGAIMTFEIGGFLQQASKVFHVTHLSVKDAEDVPCQETLPKCSTYYYSNTRNLCLAIPASAVFKWSESNIVIVGTQDDLLHIYQCDNRAFATTKHGESVADAIMTTMPQERFGEVHAGYIELTSGGKLYKLNMAKFVSNEILPQLIQYPKGCPPNGPSSVHFFHRYEKVQITNVCGCYFDKKSNQVLLVHEKSDNKVSISEYEIGLLLRTLMDDTNIVFSLDPLEPKFSECPYLRKRMNPLSAASTALEQILFLADWDFKCLAAQAEFDSCARIGPHAPKISDMSTSEFPNFQSLFAHMIESAKKNTNIKYWTRICTSYPNVKVHKEGNWMFLPNFAPHVSSKKASTSDYTGNILELPYSSAGCPYIAFCGYLTAHVKILCDKRRNIGKFTQFAKLVYLFKCLDKLHISIDANWLAMVCSDDDMKEYPDIILAISQQYSEKQLNGKIITVHYHGSIDLSNDPIIEVVPKCTEMDELNSQQVELFIHQYNRGVFNHSKYDLFSIPVSKYEHCEICGCAIASSENAARGAFGIAICDQDYAEREFESCKFCLGRVKHSLLTIMDEDTQEEQFFHEACFKNYNKILTPKCRICKVMIETSEYISAGDAHFHTKCFVETFNIPTCKSCGSLIQGEFTKIGDDSYHNACYMTEMSKVCPKCFLCEQIIDDPEFYAVKDNQRNKCHKYCLEQKMQLNRPCCVHCEQPIHGEYFKLADKRCHKSCYRDYFKKQFTQCLICKEKIKSLQKHMKIPNSRSFGTEMCHNDCMQCNNCRQNISDATIIIVDLSAPLRFMCERCAAHKQGKLKRCLNKAFVVNNKL